MGVLLGLTPPHARSLHGTRVYDFKPFYRGAKITVIGAISLKQVLAVMTLNGSMDGNAFKVEVEKCLLPQLWDGAVIELWWSLFKAFLRQFSPSTAFRVDVLIRSALDLINPKHLKNWFTSCCY